MNVRPVGNYILIELIEKEKGKVLLTDSSLNKYYDDRGMVVDGGDTEFRKGDTVFFLGFSDMEYDTNSPLRILDTIDILGFLEPE